jgi:molybdate transport system ATP-binding protein
MIRVLIKKKLKDIMLDVLFESTQKRVVLFGPSGSGKSSILKMITGFMKPKEGYINIRGNTFFDSKNKINISINKRKIGYLPQNYVLFPNMNIRDNIFYGCKFLDYIKDNNVFDAIIEKLEVRELFLNYPETLSGGQKQRVALARALFINPSILLLDEPFSALHTSIRDSLRELVIDISDEFDLPAILVTHDLDEAYVFGEWVIIIDNGKVIEQGTKDDIFKRPECIDTIKLLNIKNFWKIKERKGSTIITESGLKFTIDEKRDAVYIAVRPENIMILRENKPVTAKYDENIFRGKITKMTKLEHFAKIEFLEESTLTFIIISLPLYVITKLQLYEGKIIKVAIDKKDFILCN